MNNTCFALTHTCTLIKTFLYILYLQTWLNSKTVLVCGPKASITCPKFTGYSHISNYTLESDLTKLTCKSHKSVICLLMLHLKNLACGICSSKQVKYIHVKKVHQISQDQIKVWEKLIQLKLLVKLRLLIFASEQIHNTWDYHRPDLNRHKSIENSGPVQCTSLTWRPKFGPGYQNSLIWFSNQLLLRRRHLPLTGKIILHGSCY